MGYNCEEKRKTKNTGAAEVNMCILSVHYVFVIINKSGLLDIVFVPISIFEDQSKLHVYVFLYKGLWVLYKNIYIAQRNKISLIKHYYMIIFF